jgi:hypothetical protein
MPSMEYMVHMTWVVEFTDEFEEWWNALSEGEQEDVFAVEKQLEAKGPNLPFPYSSRVGSSRHSHMRELRIQSSGQPFRVFYAFDPRRAAILLVGGCKTGDDRFYETYVPVADGLYDVHLRELKAEGLI